MSCNTVVLTVGGALLRASHPWYVEHVPSWLSIRLCASQLYFFWELTYYPCRRSLDVEEHEVHPMKFEIELKTESERDREVLVPHLIMAMVFARALFATSRTTVCRNVDPGLTQETGGVGNPGIQSDDPAAWSGYYHSYATK